MASAMASHRSSDGSGGGLSQERLEFGEGHLDRVAVGTVGRQIQQGCAGGFDGLADASDLVGGQVGHDDAVSGVEFGYQDLFHIGLEGSPMHRPVEEHRGRQAGEAQAGGQRGGLPMAMGYGGPAPFAFARPSPQPRHLHRRAGLVDEDQPFRSEPCLAFEPEPAPREHVRALLLRCMAGLFCASARAWRRSARPSTGTPEPRATPPASRQSRPAS